jgi:hypothetical protein
MSLDSSANPLADYLAGRLSAEQLVAAVSTEYYRETGNGKRETFRPIIDVIERTHPGVVELSATADRPGFGVRLAGRPFPKRSEPELRAAVQQVLDTLPVARFPFPVEQPRRLGLLGRVLAAIRRVFR